MPRSVLAKEADATSAKMIDELKELTTKLGKELDDLHAVADSASKTLVAAQAPAAPQ